MTGEFGYSGHMVDGAINGRAGAFRSHIVGHKTETFLTAERRTERRDYSVHWIVTKHTIITELHATKGWRQTMHHKETQRRRKLPSVKEWRLNDVTTFERIMPRKDPAPQMEITEAMLERHGWYRRKMEKEGFIGPIEVRWGTYEGIRFLKDELEAAQ